MSTRRCSASWSALVLMVAAFASAPAREGSSPAAPSPESLPELAASLADRLRGVTVEAPDGSRIDVGVDLLDAGRLEQALATMGEAEAWPAGWLVVQDLERSYDLVLRMILDEKGRIATPSTVFAAARREWDDAAFESAYRQAQGAKPPRERRRNLVVQSFSKRVVTTFVYDLPKTGREARGLMALLPEGSLLREAAAIDLGDGTRHTLALVLERPTFVPSTCDPTPGAVRDHADSGTVVLYLAGERAIEGQLELTETFRSPEGGVLVPRYACAPGDDDPSQRDVAPGERFRDRELVRLLATEPRRDGIPGREIHMVRLDTGAGHAFELVAVAMIQDGKPSLSRAVRKPEGSGP